MIYSGGCHCGNIRIELATELDPGAIEVRACQCSFCRKHNSHAIADPAGELLLRVARDDLLQRYRFGLATAEYLICRNCGVYVAAITIGEPEPRAIAIVSALDERRLFFREPLAVNYDAEGREGRIERRRQRWMPVRLESQPSRA